MLDVSIGFGRFTRSKTNRTPPIHAVGKNRTRGVDASIPHSRTAGALGTE